jgi:hypothetical protein
MFFAGFTSSSCAFAIVRDPKGVARESEMKSPTIPI